LHRALGDVVHVVFHLLVDAVEQLVQRDEVRPLDVPVGLLGLRLEVDAVGEPRVEQFDRLGADLLRQVILGLEHGDWLLTPGDGSSISRPAYSGKRGRRTTCGVESSG
jgi:hypothetical protein